MAPTLRKRIIWAVDPFCRERSLLKRTASAVGGLARQWNADIEPVYLLDGWPPNVRLLPELVRNVREQAQAELGRMIRGMPVRNLLPLKMIEESTTQVRRRADLLIRYAKESHADLVAIGTRAKKGPRRWIMGSFAETLITRSDVPLFVINPQEKIPRHISQILFATDFSSQSRIALDRVIELAREVGAEITIFHRISFELAPYVEVGFGAYAEFQELFNREVKARMAQAREWGEIVRNAGLEVDLVVDYKMVSSVADAILLRTRARNCMIALAAHSGPLSSALLGSVTRQVLRRAECPVWVIHTEQRKASGGPFRITEQEVMLDLTEHGSGQKVPAA